MATIKVEVYGFEGSGATLKAAREDAQNKAREALSGYYTPRILSWRGVVLTMWRDPRSGYAYSIVSPSQGEKHERHNGSTHPACGHDEDAAWRRAVSHLAQFASTVADTEAPAFVTDKGDRASYASYWRWQRQYRALTAAGFSDDDARRILGGYLPWPESVVRVA